MDFDKQVKIYLNDGSNAIFSGIRKAWFEMAFYNIQFTDGTIRRFSVRNVLEILEKEL